MSTDQKVIEEFISRDMSENIITSISIGLAAKLASLAVHVDEMLSTDRHPFDVKVLRDLVDDPDVVEWVDKMTRAGLAPVKRRHD